MEQPSQEGIEHCAAGRLDEALRCFRAAMDADPSSRAAPYNLANTLRLMGRTEDAVAAYDEALAIAPNFSAARHNRAFALLQLGRWKEGFREYEWRKVCPGFEDPRYRLPNPWQGEDLRGKTLFIYPELYQGDLIQFIRYALLAERLGARVILAAPRNMHALLRTMSATLELIEAAETPPYYDYHCALMSLPMVFGTTPDNVPSWRYLKAAPDRVSRWSKRLGKGPKVGIVWHGGDRMTDRFFPLALVREAIADVRLISLQKYSGLDQLADCPSIEHIGGQLDTGPDAFLDTAAAIACCDIFITADTSTAHLAGAMGTRTWLALHNPADWRWLEGRSDTPWYPTMRLFRQPIRGDWKGVFAEMAQEVRLTLRLPVDVLSNAPVPSTTEHPK